MKVLAINSSPHMDKGTTSMVLEPFLEGMKQEGASVELLYTRKLKINPCEGCYTCWVKTPGVCIHHDDMQEIVLPLFENIDTWVIATPVYVDGMTGPMKNLIDRLISTGQPFIELEDDHCRHDPREDLPERENPFRIVLVSTCGFWELDNFSPLVTHVKAICKNMSAEFAGTLLRPHAGAMPAMKKMGMGIDDIFDAAREAGRQLVKAGRVEKSVLDKISRELLPRDAYIEAANTQFRMARDQYSQD